MASKLNLTDEELRAMYLDGNSSLVIAEKFGASKKLVLNRLQSLPDWSDLKKQAHSNFLRKKAEGRKKTQICEHCNTEFTSTRKQRYCGKKCIQSKWQKNDRKDNKDKINARRRENRAKKEKKLSNKTQWEQKFIEKLRTCHKRNIEAKAKRLLKRLDSVKNSMVTRSKKYGVECTITVEDLRQLALDNYGAPCKYSGRILTIDNMVFDHIIPISKGGPSTKDNIQAISKFSNSMKGSLSEDSFLMLLRWLDTVDEELRKDISIRLAHGVR